MTGRILVGDPLCAVERVREALAGLEVEVEQATAPWTGDDVVGLLVGSEQTVTAEELERLPALKVVATTSIGYDHVAVEAAARHRVAVCNVPDACVDETADTTTALLLSLLRGVVVLDRSVRAGGWDFRAAGTLKPLSGTRLGIVGLGRIGRAVAQRAAAVGFELTATDPFVGDDAFAAAGARRAGLDELLSSSDAVTLHVPLSPATEGLIGKRELELMPPGSVLVNAARGRLVDLDALVEALERGHLAGAALDVLPVEPPDAVPQAPNLIVTPHAAWFSPAAIERSCDGAIAAIRAVLSGKRESANVVGPC